MCVHVCEYVVLIVDPATYACRYVIMDVYMYVCSLVVVDTAEEDHAATARLLPLEVDICI